METVEILAGAEFSNAVKALGLTSAKCTYHYQPEPNSFCEDYQVWELSKSEFDFICNIKEQDWKDNWGWWRHNGGYNGGSADTDFIVNGEPMLGFPNVERSEFYAEECEHCPEFCNNGDCGATEEDRDECYGSRTYTDLLSYIHNELNLSTETNVCAVCIGLAYYNQITLTEVFKKYLGHDKEGDN